ncbi:MAG TPA: hypothetical protein VJ725_01415 [Thermoanaerobaculia bacterium]|nr:hypothetical protein [Thermoanaerobaculia bacterium]
MFETTSRYYNLSTLSYTEKDGRVTLYKERRFLPQGKSLPLLVEVTVEQSDRLDLIAYRTLGNPELFWRVCDANNAMDPFQLTAEPGRKLRVAIPQAT